MSKITEQIIQTNLRNEKVLSIFLTAGLPDKNRFPQLAMDIIDAGADLLEIGVPFSDPLADGPVIQDASQRALASGVTLKDIFEFISLIKSRKDTPLILMGYANPILRYGIENFMKDALNSGADGLIVPDVPYEEYNSFYCDKSGPDVILLVTPMSSEDRIKRIDKLSEGFVYCVSVTGTTGMQNGFSESTIDSVKRTYSIVRSNKMLLGFGISNENSIQQVKAYCDGVIVGSAIIKSLSDHGIKETLSLVTKLKQATK